MILRQPLFIFLITSCTIGISASESAQAAVLRVSANKLLKVLVEKLADTAPQAQIEPAQPCHVIITNCNPDDIKGSWKTDGVALL